MTTAAGHGALWTPSVTAGGAFGFRVVCPALLQLLAGGQGGLAVRAWLAELAALFVSGPRTALWRKMLILHILSAARRG